MAFTVSNSCVEDAQAKTRQEAQVHRRMGLMFSRGVGAVESLPEFLWKIASNEITRI
jgi:hypothetical protein